MERGLEIKMKRAPGGKREAGLATGGGAWSGLERMNGEEESRAEPQLGCFILRSVLYIIREEAGPGGQKGGTELRPDGAWAVGREGESGKGRGMGLREGPKLVCSAEGMRGDLGRGGSGAGCHSRETPSISCNFYFFFYTPTPSIFSTQTVPGWLGRADGRAGCSEPRWGIP